MDEGARKRAVFFFDILFGVAVFVAIPFALLGAIPLAVVAAFIAGLMWLLRSSFECEVADELPAPMTEAQLELLEAQAAIKDDLRWMSCHDRHELARELLPLPPNHE